MGTGDRCLMTKRVGVRLSPALSFREKGRLPLPFPSPVVSFLSKEVFGMSTPTIAILALQGAFIEHERMLTKLGASCFEIRNRKDLERPMDGLVLPGGESTVQGKLLKDEGLFAPLQDKIRAGLPVLATCAGMILLAEHLENDANTWFATLPVTVRRNAYGRQLGSFHTEAEFKDLGLVPMSFIRAPYVESVSDGVEILSVVDDHIVGVRYGNQIAIAFHPELDSDRKIHQMFLGMIS